jgi:hypothetical protein
MRHGQSSLLVLGLVLGGALEMAIAQTTVEREVAVAGTKQMRAEVVSIDTSGRTISVRNLAPVSEPSTSNSSTAVSTTVTLPIEAGAPAIPSTLRPGTAVLLTCRISASGATGTGTGAAGSPQAVSDGGCATVTAVKRRR